MPRLIVFGGGHSGAAINADVVNDRAIIPCSGYASERDSSAGGRPVKLLNIYETFSIRDFKSKNGKIYQIAEFEVSASDDDIEKSIALADI